MSIELTSGGGNYDTIVPVATAKAYMHQDESDDDTLIALLIDDAGEWAETYTRRQLYTATRTLRMQGFYDPRYHEPGTAGIRLPYSPLATITSIAYVDLAGTSQTVTSTDYQLDIKSTPGRVMPVWGGTWPTPRDQTYNTVTIVYTCGFGVTAASVPARIRKAMLMQIATAYEYRESVVGGMSIAEVPRNLQAESLLTAERVVEFV